jgi:hypothetical protein
LQCFISAYPAFQEHILSPALSSRAEAGEAEAGCTNIIIVQCDPCLTQKKRTKGLSSPVIKEMQIKNNKTIPVFTY